MPVVVSPGVFPPGMRRRTGYGASRVRPNTVVFNGYHVGGEVRRRVRDGTAGLDPGDGDDVVVLGVPSVRAGRTVKLVIICIEPDDHRVASGDIPLDPREE